MRALVAFMLPRAEPVITEASLDDVAELAAIHAASFGRGWSEDEFAQLLITRTVVAQRAMVRQKLAGFILSRVATGEAEILSVAVSTRFRGRGIAGKLLGAHLRRLAGLGVGVVFLEVEEHNESARRLYARAGFREVGRRAGYYRHGAAEPANALVLRRDLASA